jgi:hypothetical protein
VWECLRCSARSKTDRNSSGRQSLPGLEYYTLPRLRSGTARNAAGQTGTVRHATFEPPPHHPSRMRRPSNSARPGPAGPDENEYHSRHANKPAGTPTTHPLQQMTRLTNFRAWLCQIFWNTKISLQILFDAHDQPFVHRIAGIQPLELVAMGVLEALSDQGRFGPAAYALAGPGDLPAAGAITPQPHGTGAQSSRWRRQRRERQHRPAWERRREHEEPTPVDDPGREPLLRIQLTVPGRCTGGWPAPCSATSTTSGHCCTTSVGCCSDSLIVSETSVPEAGRRAGSAAGQSAPPPPVLSPRSGRPHPDHHIGR